MTNNQDTELSDYLARIRKTIEASNRLVDEAALRMRETDRMLERQGLTREQVMNMRFSEAQIEAANAELKRRGFDVLETWDELKGGRDDLRAGHAQDGFGQDGAPRPDTSAEDEAVSRQRKFGLMMKPFHL